MAHPFRSPCLFAVLLLGCVTENANPERQFETTGEHLAYAMPGATQGAERIALPDLSDGRAVADTLPQILPPWDPEGFEVQPHLRWLRQHTPAELGYHPGTTRWQPVQTELPPHLTRRQEAVAISPGTLLAEMALLLGWGSEVWDGVWEQTIRIRQEADDRAVAMVLHWGLADDAVAGHDLRVRMRAVDGLWYVEGVEERFHCSRGVAAEEICR